MELETSIHPIYEMWSAETRSQKKKGGLEEHFMPTLPLFGKIVCTYMWLITV